MAVQIHYLRAFNRLRFPRREFQPPPSKLLTVPSRASSVLSPFRSATPPSPFPRSRGLVLLHQDGPEAAPGVERSYSTEPVTKGHVIKQQGRNSDPCNANACGAAGYTLCIHTGCKSRVEVDFKGSGPYASPLSWLPIVNTTVAL